jgi:23S rRNA pseudouridine1911/1915/1917 synthase
MKIPFQIIYEDNHLLVVNKPAGMLVQGDSTGDKPLVEYAKEYIKDKYNKPGKVFMGVIHRLDRPVSGVVVLARTSKALERMNKIFRERKVQKVYWAIVRKKPHPKKSKLVHYLVKDTSNNTVRAYESQEEGAQKAELSYKFLGSLNNHHLLEVYPITGRPHQIRVQLASMGTPIKGDLKYGFHKPNTDGSINLHARKIYFEHPVKKESMTFKAPLPENDFWEQFLALDSIKVKDKDLDKLY